MESFIVRIYRREAKQKLIGVVEKVGTANRKVFRTIQELWTVLAGRKLPRRMRRSSAERLRGANKAR
ncbi:MAG: hypothetical protein HYT78_13235 [Deltaproteobacteria bacterium]|nr:hypothetical protein [Deltaproteobacteria bacterium]